MGEAIYVKILDAPLKDGKRDRQYSYLSNESVREYIDSERIYHNISRLPQDEFIEMGLCLRRFIYSTVLDGFSTYSSNFHHEFLIGNLVKILAAQGLLKKEIKEKLKVIFPYLTDVRLRAIVDQNMNENYVSGMRKFGLNQQREYKGLHYPEGILYFQFLTHRGAFQNELWQSSFRPPGGKRKQQSEMFKKMLQKSNILTEGNPTVLCKLCPHAEYCEDALYAVDFTKQGFDDK